MKRKQNTKQKAQSAGSKYKPGQQKQTKKNHAWIGEQPTKEKSSTKTQIQCKSNGKKRKTENEHDKKVTQRENLKKKSMQDKPATDGKTKRR